MKKMMLVVNPYAGRQQSKGFLFELVNLCSLEGYEVTVFPTQSRNATIEMVKTHAADYDMVLCCGGDGTLNEVISGLMQISVRPPLGYVPAGTTNDLANSLGIPKDPIKACRNALSGVPTPYDVGTFNDRNFAYVAAFGALTEVSYQTPQPLKNTFGHLAYVLEGIKRLPEIHPCRMRIAYDGGVLEDDYVFGAIANSTSIAGLLRLRSEEVLLSDGMFEVMLVKAPQSVLQLQKIVTGLLTQVYDEEYVGLFHTARLSVDCAEGVAWSLDGEDGDFQHHVEIANLPHSITFLTNGVPG